MADGAARRTPIDGDKLEDLIGLCLSGGGYRAMLFHAGTVARLNDLGLLPKLDRVSSVSGGSMTAAALALAYSRFAFDGSGRATNLRKVFLEPLLAQANDSIDVSAGFAGLNPFSSAAEEAAASYRRNLTGAARLADLPARPTFVFNATNLMTGDGLRIRKDFVADYQIGEIVGVNAPLSAVVAASAAFPPFLSPATLDLSGGHVKPGTAGPLATPPFLGTAVLTDGGVYDNLGTETVWKRCRTVLVSDAGKPFSEEPTPHENWLQQSLRVIDIVMDQAQDLRERILVHAYEIGARHGAMWGLTARSADPSGRSPHLSVAELAEAAAVSTRLWRMPVATQALLLKAGYVQAAARIRAKWTPAAGGPADIPDDNWPAP